MRPVFVRRGRAPARRPRRALARRAQAGCLARRHARRAAGGTLLADRCPPRLCRIVQNTRRKAISLCLCSACGAACPGVARDRVASPFGIVPPDSRRDPGARAPLGLPGHERSAPSSTMCPIHTSGRSCAGSRTRRAFAGTSSSCAAASPQAGRESNAHDPSRGASMRRVSLDSPPHFLGDAPCGIETAP